MSSPWKYSRLGRTRLWAPYLYKDVPAHWREELDYMAFKGSFQPKPFSDTVILWSPTELQSPYGAAPQSSMAPTQLRGDTELVHGPRCQGTSLTYPLSGCGTRACSPHSPPDPVQSLLQRWPCAWCISVQKNSAFFFARLLYTLELLSDCCVHSSETGLKPALSRAGGMALLARSLSQCWPAAWAPAAFYIEQTVLCGITVSFHREATTK